MGADKSLARPGRKQATATKLGICSIFSPRSSIHCLARCSNFCKQLKKTQKAVSPTRSLQQQWPPRRKKNGDLSFVFFSVQRIGGSPMGPDSENRVGDQDIWSPGRPVYCGLQVPSEHGALSCKNKTPLVIFQRLWRFSFKMSFSCTSNWMIIQEKDAFTYLYLSRKRGKLRLSHTYTCRDRPLGLQE